VDKVSIYSWGVRISYVQQFLSRDAMRKRGTIGRRLSVRHTRVLYPNGCRSIKFFFTNQSIKTHLYSAICRKRIRGACWARLGRVFTFAVCSVKQFSFQSTPEQNRTEQNFITTSKSTYGRLPE